MAKAISKPHPKSPCIGVCAVSARTNFCIGCGRKLMEIADWQNLSAQQKQIVLDALPARLAIIEADATARLD
ncbi:MAG: DUF1289 domain-containing protein [Parvibaculales bacterium]